MVCGCVGDFMQMNKIYLILTALLFISFASAIYYEQSVPIYFKESCTSDGAICNSTASCNLSIQFPNSTYLVTNGIMTNQNNGDFNYTLNTTQTGVQGAYTWDMYCCEGTLCGESHGGYDINSVGIELTTSKSIIYIILTVIFVLLFILILYFMGKLSDEHETNEDGEILSLSKTKYIKSVLVFVDWMILIAIFYITSNIAFAYLGEQLFGKILFTFFKICFALTIPLVVIWFIWIFIQIVMDKKLKEMLAKGLYQQGGKW